MSYEPETITTLTYDLIRANTKLKPFIDVCDIAVEVGETALWFRIEEYPDKNPEDFDDEPFDDYPKPAAIKDHADLLDIGLHGLSLFFKDEVRGLTVDGDNKSCEAIFLWGDQPYIMRAGR